MENTIAPSARLAISAKAAWFSLTASAGALVSLGCLHFLSPEFDPSWRVVSEYALGSYGWLLSIMFLAWALGTWALAFAIRSQVATVAGRVGLIFLVAAGAGEALAAAFDVTWPRLHALAGLLGVPTLPIAAVLISVSLGKTVAWASARRRLLWTASFTWASLAVMGAAMFTLKKGVGGVRVPIGWPNRLLVVIYALWVMTVAYQAIRLHRSTTGPASPGGLNET